MRESVEFYTSHLGFDLVQRFGQAIAILQREDLELLVSGPKASASRPMLDGSKPEPGGWSRFVITVDDLEIFVAQLRTQGVVFRNDIELNEDRKQILCEDPSGNVMSSFRQAERLRVIRTDVEGLPRTESRISGMERAPYLIKPDPIRD